MKLSLSFFLACSISLSLLLPLARFHFCKWNCPGTEKRFKLCPSVFMHLTTKYHPAKRPCNFLKRKEARWSDKEENCWVWKCEKRYPLGWSNPQFFVLTEALSFSHQTLAVSAEISVTGDRTHLNIFHPGNLMWLWERELLLRNETGSDYTTFDICICPS